jgi:hypothetical protein
MRYDQKFSFSKFNLGFESFFVAIAAWIIHLGSQGLTKDFWYALAFGSHLVTGRQRYSLFTRLWDWNLNEEYDTFPGDGDKT